MVARATTSWFRHKGENMILKDATVFFETELLTQVFIGVVSKCCYKKPGFESHFFVKFLSFQLIFLCFLYTSCVL